MGTQLTIAIHELVSWAITVVSVTLFVLEKRRNTQLPLYMALQGILKSCHEKTLFYWKKAGNASENHPEGVVNLSEYVVMLESASSDFQALKQNILGSMKGIVPDADLPFYERGYTQFEPPSSTDEVIDSKTKKSGGWKNTSDSP